MIKAKVLGWVAAGLLTAGLVPGVSLAKTMRHHAAPAAKTHVAVKQTKSSVKPQAKHAPKKVIAKSTRSHSRKTSRVSSKRMAPKRSVRSTSHRKLHSVGRHVAVKSSKTRGTSFKHAPQHKSLKRS